ncbi:MAG: D-alanyl-D-alanine carboxypeptidase family protein [Pseudomonadota bacterium]
MKILFRAIGAVIALFLGLIFLAAATAAEAAPQASIVMDMRNGKVLYARSADRKVHPASLTKMMTLYLTFEAVRQGRIRLDQKVRVSRKASRQPASKLYLKAGQRVTIRSLIRATAIKSANDAAMVLAEAVGGSQHKFARMMTAKARALGMNNTVFKNPHGLTQAGHYSTARDMAILGRHLFYDFPKYYNIFKRRSDHAAGRRIWTTNRLLSTYAGADGIKTGYTRAAGYNLAASAHRGKKRILAVVLGARSSGDRARKVARLLDMGFSRAKTNVRTAKPRQIAPATGSNRSRILVKRSPLPPTKPGLQRSVAMAVAEVLASPAAAATPEVAVIKPTVSKPVEPAPVRERAPTIKAGPGAPRVAELPVPRPSMDRVATRNGDPRQLKGTMARVPIPLPRPVRVASR